ncbi:redoxin domain-containing protein [Mucilaginibacter arboris]|uniref:Redoxin domain-containing protein n=1 Tax=Mucilaginibacter arboris TaxID=2682090 RepID=A0A7K1SSU1_9SPHI|nr:redoxin domain-containing protein [Mucilaginibacter arboris]MVN20371.1 redoxin domain-containing protein [Mucilaginibacter arboris]
MLPVTYQFPVFDFTELVHEPVISKKYQPLKPLQAGQLTPDIKLINKNGTWLNSKIRNYEGTVFTYQLLSKPLVISFYAEAWNRKGIHILKKLNAIQNEILAAGGNLLIVTAEGPFAQAEVNWKHHFNLSFYHDVNHEIARKFNVFSEEDPIWNKFSGIDVNAPLLATYVLSPAGQIVYDHIDTAFNGSFPVEEIINATKNAR